jgi:hypothetical protein
MQENARTLAQKLKDNGNFELIGEDQEQLPLVAFKLAGEKNYDEFDLSWQLSAERGWMLPAYTMPPDAEEVKVLRALVKQTLSREQVDRLADDIALACATLEKRVAPTLRAQAGQDRHRLLSGGDEEQVPSASPCSSLDLGTRASMFCSGMPLSPATVPGAGRASRRDPRPASLLP